MQDGRKREPETQSHWFPWSFASVHLLLRQRWDSNSEENFMLRRSVFPGCLSTLEHFKRGIFQLENICFYSHSCRGKCKFVIMSQSWCGQAILRVELGILVAVLVGSSMAQIYERREEGSSCYGGFDLYFVLDKWVLLLSDNHRRSSFRVFAWLTTVYFDVAGAKVIAIKSYNF